MAKHNGSRRVSAVAKEVAEHASTLTRLELELAALEVKRKARAFGMGAGFGLAAAVLAVLGVCFALATGAAALATTMDVWLALLIMTGGLLLLAGIAGVVAVGLLRRSTPIPKKAIREAKLTTEAFKR